MNIVEVVSLSEANRILDEGTDIAVMGAKDSLGTYCHVMIRSEDIVHEVEEKLGYKEVNRNNGHVCLFVYNKQAREVIVALRSLTS